MLALNRREFLSRLFGNSLLAAGGSLFGAAVAYQVYRTRSTASLSGLRAGAPLRPPVPDAAGAAPAQPVSSSAAGTAAPQDQAVPTAAVQAPQPAAPGEEPPVFAATAPAVAPTDTPPGLIPVSMNIESIGLQNAKVTAVGTVLDKGQLVWQTADHAVGYLVGTALPGRTGNLVLAGHISSPVRGEGNVFHDLPNLADKIGSHVSVQTADGSWFVYSITGTDVVTPADIWVMDPTPKASVTLVTCVPDGVYTHRFVARGDYVGRG